MQSVWCIVHGVWCIYRIYQTKKFIRKRKQNQNKLNEMGNRSMTIARYVSMFHYKVVEVHGKRFKLYHSGMFGEILYHGFCIMVQCLLIVVQRIKRIHINHKRTSYDKRRKILLKKHAKFTGVMQTCDNYTRKINSFKD